MKVSSNRETTHVQLHSDITILGNERPLCLKVRIQLHCLHDELRVASFVEPAIIAVGNERSLCPGAMVQICFHIDLAGRDLTESTLDASTECGCSSAIHGEDAPLHVTMCFGLPSRDLLAGDDGSDRGKHHHHHCCQ